jgi:hypothetical protein
MSTIRRVMPAVAVMAWLIAAACGMAPIGWAAPSDSTLGTVSALGRAATCTTARYLRAQVYYLVTRVEPPYERYLDKRFGTRVHRIHDDWVAAHFRTARIAEDELAGRLEPYIAGVLHRNRDSGKETITATSWAWNKDVVSGVILPTAYQK